MCCYVRRIKLPSLKRPSSHTRSAHIHIPRLAAQNWIDNCRAEVGDHIQWFVRSQHGRPQSNMCMRAILWPRYIGIECCSPLAKNNETNMWYHLVSVSCVSWLVVLSAKANWGNMTAVCVCVWAYSEVGTHPLRQAIRTFLWIFILSAS